MIVDDFLQKMSFTLKRLQARQPDPLASSGMHALYQAAREGETIFFSEGTSRMLLEKVAHFEETIQEVQERYGQVEDVAITESLFKRGAWIVFPSPMFPQSICPVSALFCFMPSQYLETGKDKYLLYLVDQKADVAYMLSSVPNEAWQFDAQYHQCHACQREYGVIIPCDTCKALLLVWSEVFAIASIITVQYLAERRYEEKTFITMRRVPREKNSKKMRAQAIKRTVKVIDANEIVIPVPPPDDSQHTKGERGSWLIPALEENRVEYIEKRTRPFIRTYRHERYKASGLQGQTTTFPEGIVRKQPVLKDRQHIKKVKASKYGDS